VTEKVVKVVQQLANHRNHSLCDRSGVVQLKRKGCAEVVQLIRYSASYTHRRPVGVVACRFTHLSLMTIMHPIRVS
jgi:hypothetical protein